MDNLNIHKTTCLCKTYSSYHVKVLFLPPYCPEFSAIESLFGNIKSKLKNFKIESKE